MKLMSHAFAAGMLAALMSARALAVDPTVELTSSATSGISPLTFTLTWTSSGATSCIASGGWSGTKATSGTQTITSTTVGDTSYRLDCKAADTPGSASTSWTPPTQNTDGSALTNLAGYRLSYGASPTALTQVLQIPNPGIKAYVVNGVAAGTYYFGVRAYTTSGVESDLSNVQTKVVASTPGAVTSDEVSIKVDTKPKPPVLTLDTQAYEIRTKADGTLVATRIGLVPLGTACSERQQKVGAVTYSQVPRDAVDMVNWPSNVKLRDVWASCG